MFAQLHYNATDDNRYCTIMSSSTFELLIPITGELGESPRWDERGQILYWVDITGMKLHRLHLPTMEHRVRGFDQPVACVVLDQGDGLVLGMKTGVFHLASFDASPVLIVASPELDLATNRFNDGRCDSAGRLVIGSVYPPKDRGGANCYVVDAVAKTIRAIQDDLMTANGIAFSPDGKTLYLSDTPRHIIYRYQYDPTTGQASGRETFATFPDGKGRPDGAAVDSEGCYWTALFDGARVVRLSPAGEELLSIPFPAPSPTMVAFGGSDRRTLFATCVAQDGICGIYHYQTNIQNVHGLPEGRCNV